ncbi:Gfo/Idh/MocA family protein [Deinococcus peraridilitoris]|uniref:Putative dehydrogenase n=1 Tax=Deinococcus peraridilitoris (strain DSM 19664 / LMG 22246 / CIP 109416 / KR-200) TaxID=937777 RepID=K9ZXQ4_DEIPD|nr:Gfo/Idh/MocA family oxidoreductase [Deinococcus peraridilitoris]AFZ65682.1 putative dehydrogenase [Deinococcus peraridilitoris DSM 19664]
MNHTDSTIRVGIIGLGAIGGRLLREFQAHDAFQVTHLHDSDAARSEEAARETGAVACATSTELLASDVDLVYIAVPPSAHFDLTLAALKSGKHVLCEKPLAVSTEEARAMLGAARAAGRVHAMQLPLYHSPGVRVFAERLHSGTLGDLRRADLTLVFPEWPRAWQMNPWIGRREQGGPIRECTPHLFEVIERSLGRVARLRADVVYPVDGVSSEESAHGVLELESGLRVGVSLLCHVQRPETVALTVYGANGTLGLERWTQPVYSADQDIPKALALEADTTQGKLLDHLAAAIHGREADLPGFGVGLRLQCLQEAWEQASATGSWIVVGPE